ncbi:class I SAM-dependent methyltransferase [Ktedonosporobacter rubrisoli]|uniref:Class I SAM-dependent methyltransferase n=1 Tax=Ktedonosporobacter rubrisoli TaxID=2509675 RepID=A0A4P6JLM3_KTERU|nr:class I SAM-dependent methyltransferase [Ktedonosporobacter rubrisoli]QBD76105.1 class I SAM-dependent methyltransferase [Ktedonosporobacter rubrisoli]
MEPKPAHLGLQYASQFKDHSIVDVYHYRPSYPAEAIAKLVSLITDEPRTVLDVGCGTGELARQLVTQVERVDAVDFSRAMLDKGRTLPGGDHPQLRWIYGRVEEAALQPPYALITAGESLHWMEWDVVLPLFRRMLTPHGLLAMAERGSEPEPWQADLLELIKRFSTNKEFQPYDLIAELKQRKLFRQEGIWQTRPVPFTQSVEDYISSIHSRNGFSRERMDTELAQAFDAEARKLLLPFAQDGMLKLMVTSNIIWGRP